MKKILTLFIFTALFLSLIPCVPALAAPDNSADAAILMDAETGTVLYEKNPDARMLIASTTKILTALVVLNNCDLDSTFEVTTSFPYVEGSSMYLKHGEKLTVRDLLYGLMLASGNDAAVALALKTSGSIEKFAELMNDTAKELGCENSSFKNPHGLDAKNHYSCARDLAVITAAAMRNKTFAKIVSTKSISVAGRSLKNHNKLLWSCEGALGVKTGYTESAGRSLVSCVERDGMRLICVTLSAPNDWTDHTELYNWAYNEYQCFRINRSDTKYGSIPVISGEADSVPVRPSRDYFYICSKADKIECTGEIYKFVYSPVIKGARAGVLYIKKNGEVIEEIPLVYSETVRLDKNVPLSKWEKLKWAWYFANKNAVNSYGYYVY
jgi:D-alanyl-D-alanine carboxypeptidase (penicillin-binding protein 5/6)